MLRAGFFGVLCLCIGLAEEFDGANPPAVFSITWKTNAPNAVLVRGVTRAKDAPERMLQVHVEQADLRAAIGLPAMIGRYEFTNEGLEFRPPFPFERGVRYRATFHPEGERTVSSVLEIPVIKRKPSTVVTHIYPTAELLPENLLKFYINFSAPMSGGHIYEHIRLTDQRGKIVELPFLEIDEELWNPQMTRLTLFLDPGRIKRGVKPLEEVGPALEEGKSYTLTIDHAWIDADGTPLKESFEKKFHVAGTDREAPDLAAWEITAPKAGTLDPLKVGFSDPMDHALALRMITVEKVSGTPALDRNERGWTFTPKAPWTAGTYRLLVQTTIEDLAGNNLGKPFEVDLFSGVQKRLTRDVVSREFEVK